MQSFDTSTRFTGGATCRLAVVGLGILASIAQAGTFDLLVVSKNTDAVVRFDDSGQYRDLVLAPNLSFPRDMTMLPAQVARGVNDSIAVTDLATNTLHLIDLATGTRTAAFACPQLALPDGLTRAANGDLLVSSTSAQAVLRFDLVTGACVGTFANLASPGALAIGPDGHLYAVSNTIFPSQILKFDGQTGAPMGVFATLNENGSANSLRFFSDGNLYVPFTAVPFGGRTKVFDGITGNFIGDTFNSFGVALGDDDPDEEEDEEEEEEEDDLGASARGTLRNIFVTEPFANAVHRFDGASGLYMGVFNMGIPGFFLPQSIRFGPDGNLYVSQTAGPASIVGLDSQTGMFQRAITALTGANRPEYAAVGPDDAIYLANTFDNNIVRVDPITGASAVFASHSTLRGPRGIAWRDNQLYAASFERNRVLRFDMDGNFVDTFATPSEPEGIAFGPAGAGTGQTDLYVSSGLQVRRYNGDSGALVGVFTDGMGLFTPKGLTFGPDGDLYVANFFGPNIQVFDGATGDFLRQFGDGSVNRPAHLAFHPDSGNLLVTETVFPGQGTMDQVLEFTPAGALVGPFAAMPALQNPGAMLFVAGEPAGLLGDLNCDGVVSVGDINPFVLALTDPAAYAAAFPDCDALNGDCNEDGQISVGDINCFVALVTGTR